MAISGCQWSGVGAKIASMSGRSSTRRKSWYPSGAFPENFLTTAMAFSYRGLKQSQTAATSQLGLTASASRCRVPIPPQPITPRRTRSLAPSRAARTGIEAGQRAPRSHDRRGAGPLQRLAPAHSLIRSHSRLPAACRHLQPRGESTSESSPCSLFRDRAPLSRCRFQSSARGARAKRARGKKERVASRTTGRGTARLPAGMSRWASTSVATAITAPYARIRRIERRVQQTAIQGHAKGHARHDTLHDHEDRRRPDHDRHVA